MVGLTTTMETQTGPQSPIARILLNSNFPRLGRNAFKKRRDLQWVKRRQNSISFTTQSLVDAMLAEIVAKKEGYLMPPSLDTLGSIAPPVFVQHDPPPPPSPEASPNGASQTAAGDYTPINYAHLYLSPAHHIGDGNHSVVYRAEWEIPRSSIFPPDPVLCKECVNEDVRRTLRKEDGDEGERKADEWKEKRSMV